MAPEVSRTVQGQCPGCGALLSALFHVPGFVVGELRRASVAIGDETDLIAAAYHWPEAAILALPRARRQDYAARIRARWAA